MSGDIEAAARKIFDHLPGIDGDEADWMYYEEYLYAGARDAFAALVAERDALRKALEPFSEMAGELFSRNWNNSDVVVALDNPDEPHRVTAGDFFAARAALSPSHVEGK
jgi:hypothetical protein